MAKRPAHTLIFLGTHRTDRVDLGVAPAHELLGQHHQVWQGADDPAIRVEAALASGPKPGKSLWVLWEGVGAQVLDMPTAVVAGLEREQLALTLSFEAEPLTGIPSSDSAIDGVPQRNAPGALPEFRRFWVAQISASVLGKLEEVVSKAGAALAGITHPGGLPVERWDVQLPESGPSREWRRIEIWDQLTFSLHGRADGTVETRLIRSNPGSEGWSAELPTDGSLSWMGPGPVSRIGPDGRRVADALTPRNAEGLPLEYAKIDLPADEAATGWLRAWAVELTAKSRRVPVIESASRHSPNRKFYLAGGIAAALVLAACGAHYTMIGARTAKLHAEAARLETFRAAELAPRDKDKKEEASLVSETTKLLAALKELDVQKAEREVEFTKAEKAAAEIAARQSRLKELRAVHRPAVAELLAALADAEKTSNTGEIITKEIRQEKNGDLRLSGLCRHTGSADAFATRFETRLNECGWRVGAAQKQLRPDGLAFDFAILLTPTVLLDSSIPMSPIGAPPRTAAASPNVARNDIPPVPTPTGVHRP